MKFFKKKTEVLFLKTDSYVVADFKSHFQMVVRISGDIFLKMLLHNGLRTFTKVKISI
jgi:hypothetical protein